MPGRNREFQADLEPVTAQVAAQYHNKHGGSSIYVHGGNMPTKGYAVGGLPGVPEQNVDSPNLTPHQVQANRDRVRDAYPGDPSAVAGSWQENGRSVLDGSSIFHDRSKAARAQSKRDQRAVYNISKGKEEDLR